MLAAGAPDWVYERQSEQPYAPPAPFPLAHLIESLEQNRPPAATIEDARTSFRFALAAYDSAREQRPVILTWPDAPEVPRLRRSRIDG